MAFDVWIVCLIGCAFVMFMISLAQDLILGLRRRRELKFVPSPTEDRPEPAPIAEASTRVIPLFARARFRPGASTRLRAGDRPTQGAVA